MLKILLAEDDDIDAGLSGPRAGAGRLSRRRGRQRPRRSAAARDASRFDLLLTDIVMPEMDGIELAQKAAEIAPDIRVMFITGFAAVALKAGRKTPDAKVLSKPFHLRDLVAEVERMFMTEDQHGRL